MKISKAVMLVLALSFTGVASADESATLKMRVQAAMNKYCAAIRANNFKSAAAAVRGMFAKDCVFTGGDGKTMTLDQWLKTGEQEMKSMKSVSVITVTCTAMKAMGNSATGTGKFHMIGTMANPDTKSKKKTVKLEVSGNATFKLAKRNGKWWVVSHKEGEPKVLIDGKSAGQMR